MILFFKCKTNLIIAVETSVRLSKIDRKKLTWLFDEAELLTNKNVHSYLLGPRREMITPWSTNAVEIIRNMGIEGVNRVEEFLIIPNRHIEYDPMLQRIYSGIGQDIFTINKRQESIVSIDDIAVYNQQEGLALSPEEIEYLNHVSEKLGRKLTDSEVFGFSQVNSEHCRHKIFNGVFIINGVAKKSTLFELIRKTSQLNPNQLISAYNDNVAFNAGPVIEQFAPRSADKPDYFSVKNIETVLSLKAETHNFPTTVEPFNGAATGVGGEIRDRMGGGKASLPIAGTAVYMTSYPRTEGDRPWEKIMPLRKWLYQTPAQILIKASNGASDFGNKFGQPLICGSLLTFEHEENRRKFAYDKVVMLAGGVGFANKRDALKGKPKAGEKVVILSGDNYRIGIGGGAVSSVATGEYNSGIELNAVQRANPEMQKRVSNVIRALAESDDNPIVSIHDHGAGGHLNCISELVEPTGGKIDMSKLPIGDPTLSSREIIGNESQERMGLLLKKEDIDRVQKIAARERAPMYVVGEITGDNKLVFEQTDGKKPLDMHLADFFGKPPRTVMNDMLFEEYFKPVGYSIRNLDKYLENVLQLESVACKDWLTNKVDRSITGKIARQQCQGEIQLPLSDLGAAALDFRGKSGVATSIGHAPQAGLIDPAAGSVLSIAEALTNIVFAPLKEKMESVSLSANWMWPCKNPGEDARLYEAVKACSDFACGLGINIPTGKDSLSMTQKYGVEKVFSPGTVIISAGAEVSNIRKIVSPVLLNNQRTALYYIDFSFNTFKLGGSAFAQSLNRLGDEVPVVTDAEYFRSTFDIIQELIDKELIIAGHDISAGGMIVTLLEMTFGNTRGGLNVNLDKLIEEDLIKILFSENPGIVIQVEDKQAVENILTDNGIGFVKIGKPCADRYLTVSKDAIKHRFDIDYLRDIWYYSSYLLDCFQSGEKYAKDRFINYKRQPLQIKFNREFAGTLSGYGLSFDRQPSGIKAAIVREKGTNGDREMAYALYLAGFDVKDVHTTDLVSGRETLEDINMLVFCGGFANSDVFGSAKGWAGSLMYSEKAKKTLDKYYARPNTLSLGICNGCQLMIALNLIFPKYKTQPQMLHNDSHKFESGFISLMIPKNKSIMLGSLAGSKLGVWVAHGEGKFSLPLDERRYFIAAKYVYNTYPGNPNGSNYAAAGVCSKDGRHLAMMPHPERAIFPWQCAYYPVGRKNDEITPWIEAFVNARKWIEDKIFGLKSNI
ncbi:MAG: phosphoribosylformylglycinamidine synthase [Dysgonamonadaceae bacterium]|jgi:phosphoribosylformylglycinamidine synthase|nr:phosphoribosylformylglycinamidine synthase [Dysgonamonadaceae bacterium]